jgi:hypothetical protein
MYPSAGGGRGGSGRRGGRTTYRRVQAAVGDDKSSVDDVPNGKKEPAFQSSLRSSLKDLDPPPAPAKQSERSVRVEKERSSKKERRRSRSPAPQKRDLQVQTKGARQVISLSSPSPQKGAGQTKRFVSSLAQSIGHEERGAKQDRREERGGRGQGSSLRRSNSREPRQRPGEGQGSFRNAGRGSGSRSVSRTRLTRKNSTDSVSSQRSDRSDRSFRSDRYSEEYRSSLNDGPQPVRRLSSGSASFKASGSQSVTKSSQDARSQKERPASGSIGRSIGRPAQDTTSRRASLDGGASSLRRLNPNSPLGVSAGALSSQGAGSSDAQRSPPAPGGLRKNAPVGDSISPKPLKATAGQEKEDNSVKAPSAPVVDDAERKRLAETLKERMESRKLQRGSSLAEMMKAPLDRKSSVEDEAQESPFGGRKELQSDKPSGGDNAEKEARRREYYAKLDKENADREAAHRAAPFKSSLTASIEPPPAEPPSASNDTAPPRTLREALAARGAGPVRTPKSFLAARGAGPARTLKPSVTAPIKSSLTASLAPSRPTVARINKLLYSLAELQRYVEWVVHVFRAC